MWAGITFIIYLIGLFLVLRHYIVKAKAKGREVDGDDLLDAICWPLIAFVHILLAPFYLIYKLAEFSTKVNK